MRRRIAVPLILIAAALPWYWFKPPAPNSVQRAELVSVTEVRADGEWFGGLSGIDLSPDGRNFHVVTDRGHRAIGEITREDGKPGKITISDVQPLLDRFGERQDFPHTDAEGIALGQDNRVYVSFEHAHRVLAYDDWDATAVWPGYTRSWRAFGMNQGLEALAIDADGTLYAIPEGVARGATEALVYVRETGMPWTQPFTIPIDWGLKPVGADFGPDGRLYLLERGIYPFAFYSRVRSMLVGQEGVSDITTELETPLGLHGNLEGIAVWRDADGTIRLTMVADDNFLFFLSSDFVEYRIIDRVAHRGQ